MLQQAMALIIKSSDAMVSKRFIFYCAAAQLDWQDDDLDSDPLCQV